MTAPTALLRPDPALLPHPPLVDVHVHLAADGGDGLPAGQWAELAASAGIRVAGVVSPARPSYARANAALLAWATRQEPDERPALRPIVRLGGRVPVTTASRWQLRNAARSRLGRPVDLPALPGDALTGPATALVDRVEQDLRDRLRRFAGVKIVPQVDGIPDETILEAVDELRLPVLVPAGEGCPPSLVDKRLVQRLRGPVILCHLGSYPGSAPHFAEAVALAQQRPNVYLETSAAWLAEFLAHAAREVPDKLMFGSGAPFVHPRVAWHHVASAIDDDALEAVAHLTAERVLGW